MADYALPDLPYDYSALEPYISGTIMELHHSNHHNAYVTGANTAVEQFAEARDQRRSVRWARWRRTSRSTWPGTSTTRCSGPTCPRTAVTGPLATWPPRSTSSSATSMLSRLTSLRTPGHPGSGWSILTYDVLAKRLYIVQLYDHQATWPPAWCRC